MNKLLFSLLLAITSSPLYAAPYVLLQSHLDSDIRGSQRYAIDHIVNQESIAYLIFIRQNNTQTPLTPDKAPVNPTKAYNAWFENLNDLITAQNREEEFSFMRDIIEFGMSEKVLYHADEELVSINAGLSIGILETDDPYWNRLKTLASGSFDKGLLSTFIYLRQASPAIMQQVLIHEVGHSLGIADSYGGGAKLKDIVYSSDLRPSIMDRARALTCDDADALANAIYLTMRKTNKIPQDYQDLANNFEFKSFCPNENGERISFRNGMQTNKKPMLNFFNGCYYITEFCKTGQIKSSLKIDFRAPLDLLEKTTRTECDAIPYTLKVPDLPKDDGHKYILVDLTSDKRKKVPADKNTIVYEYAPGGIIREITFNNEVSRTMVKIKNNEGRLLYVYAILDDQRALAYAVTDRTMFVYNMRNYNKFAIIQSRDNKISSSDQELITPEEAKKIRDFINKGRLWLYGTFESGTTTDKHILQATRWQGYLQKYYPHKDFKTKAIKISKKDLERFEKGLNKNFF